MSNKSIAVSPYTMPAALAAADDLLSNPTWSANPDNRAQVLWASRFRRLARFASELPEIHRNATLSAVDHTAWLRSEGWDAQVTQGGPDDVFLAATINITAKWLEVGYAYKAGSLDRVLLKKGATAIFDPSGTNVHPAVMVSTQSAEYAFFFHQLDRAPRDTDDLLQHVLNVSSKLPSLAEYSDEVRLDFPMVDLCVKDDATYMIGLRSGTNIVTQAAEQFRLSLNETGGRARAAAEVAVSRGMAAAVDTVRIDGPFVVAVLRRKILDLHRESFAMYGETLFAAYVDTDSWKRPADGRI